MQQKSLSSSLEIFVAMLVIGVFSILAGCAALEKSVPTANRIALSREAPSQGTFSYGDLTVQYTSTLDGQQITVSGRIDFRRSFDSLDVSVLVVDAAGDVVGKSLVYASGFRTGTDRVEGFAFHKGLVLPAGAEAISFSYAVQDRRSYK